MKNLSFILQKEFRQIRRNKVLLRMMLMMPIVQLILIPLAADYEIKQIKVSVIDHDHSAYSRRLSDKLAASNYFRLVLYSNTYSKALQLLGEGEADIILSFPPRFERDLIRENKSKISIEADASNNIKAGLGTSYIFQIIADFNNEIREEWLQTSRLGEVPQVKISAANWYNPHTNYKLFMVPGILAILVTMVGSALATMNIVAEKEMGTIEQINVTPIKKYEFILGKLIPFWLIGLLTMTLGMVAGFLVFGIVPVGSYFSIYAFSAVYLLGVLGIGLLISTFSDSLQQSTLMSFFFMMIFVLMSGLYTPIESMPEWAKMIAHCNPPMYFVRAIRSIFIKGSTFNDLISDFYAIAGFSVLFNALAIWNYRKRNT